MIDLALLGLLKDQDLHGYELRKQLGELLGSRLAISFGSIYPALAKLERNGSVKAVTDVTRPRPAVPLSGSLAGELATLRAGRSSLHKPKRGSRGKKVYGITDLGHEQFHKLMTDSEVTDRDFPVRVAFCHHLSSEERLALFERRRAVLHERHVGQDGASPAEVGGRINRYLRSLIEHDTEVASADMAWLERLIYAERAGSAAVPHEPGENVES